MHKIGRVVVAALLLAGPQQLSAAAPAVEFWLENGMQVVVIEDQRSPAVTHMVLYRVGAADEPPGKSGIAHFVEHLMFRGTDEYGPGEIDRIVESVGGVQSAFTSPDQTGYYQRVAAEHLETVMELESVRMDGLLITDEDIAIERNVVLEERNERTDSSPDAQFAEQRRAALYLNHPYGIPTIGWRHEIEALDRDDIFGFYRRYYAPNNAILVVAGSVEPEVVLSLAEKHYGSHQASAEEFSRARRQEPPHRSARRLSMSDPRVAQPYFVRSYLAPERDPGDQEAAAALTILAEILGGGGINSVFSQELELRTEKAIYTSASYGGSTVDDTSFVLFALPKEGVALDELEAEMDRVIADFLEEGVDEDHLARVKVQLRAAWIYAQDDVQGLGFEYGKALANGLSINDVEEWPAVLDAVTADDIVEAATAVFSLEKSVTGWMMPAGTDS